MKLSALTWNVWDTPYFGSRDNEERMKRLVDYLYRTEPHVVLLQESFNPERRKKFLETLGSYDSGYKAPANVHEERKLLGFIPFFDATGGLVTLSRYPIRSSVFYPFETHGKSWDERFCGKGYTQTFVNTPEGQILVVNTHLSNRPTDTQTRLAQLEELLDDLENVDVPVVLGGDFNTTRFDERGEQTEEFTRLQHAGFADSLVGREEDFETFSHRNQYSHYPEHGRIDFVFYREGKHVKIKPQTSNMVGVNNPISDHYGYLAELEISRDA